MAASTIASCLVLACAVPATSATRPPVVASLLNVTWLKQPEVVLADTSSISAAAGARELERGLGEGTPKKTVERTAELLRFVTAYNRRFETLVDITPFSALLRRAVDKNGKLEFYAYIGSGGRNATDTLVFNKVSRDCYNQTMAMNGVGFNVQAELEFFPRSGFVDTRPYIANSLLQGGLSSHTIGGTSFIEGRVEKGQNSVFLEALAGKDQEEFADGDNTNEIRVTGSPLYGCSEGKATLLKAVRMGMKLQQVREDTKQHGNQAAIKESLDFYKSQLSDSLVQVRVRANASEGGLVEAEYDSANAEALEPGLPVYYKQSMMEAFGDNNNLRERSLKPIGRVSGVHGSLVQVMLNAHCQLDSLWVAPASATQRAAGLAQSFAELALETRWKEPQGQPVLPHQLLYVHGDSYSPGSGGVLATTGWNYHGMVVRRSENHAALLEYDTRVKENVLHRESVLDGVHVNLSRQTRDRDSARTKEEYRFDSDDFDAPSGFLDATSAYDFQKAPLAAFKQMTRHLGKQSVAPRVKDEVTNAVSGLDETIRMSAMEIDSKRSSLRGSTSPRSQAVDQLSSGSRVCLLSTRERGNIMQRDFKAPVLRTGERALLHFTSTGHGWSGSTAQCGEFCEMVYRLRLNGERVADVSFWRDCSKNPISPQDGTWDLSRNGWCPGSVSPGIYVDVTHALGTQASANEPSQVSAEIFVRDGVKKKFQTYTNFGQVSGGDTAKLFMAMNLFVYEAEAVKAVMAQPGPLSPAETAIREGRSQPLGVPKDFYKDEYMEEYVDADDTPSISSASADAAQGAGGVDLASSAPWFLDPGPYVNEPESRTMRVFSGALLQAETNARLATKIDEELPSDWGQVALRLIIEQPSGQDFDFWDRIGSFGLVLPKEID